jgi:GTPase SAR1 family protein
MPFGQVVIGPPGSGKTTYCNGMKQFLNSTGRKTIIVNLDAANENLPYECEIDIQDLICIETVMEELHLGPNGGIIYCMEYLVENIDWLKDKLDSYKDHYVLFDFPGQSRKCTRSHV